MKRTATAAGDVQEPMDRARGRSHAARRLAGWIAWCAVVLAAGWLAASGRAQTCRIATYNVETYLDQPTASRRQVKSAAARAKVCASILAARPDVIALEEMGARSALMELRASLRAGGLNYPDWDWMEGADTNIHLAVLSRFPLVARRPHTNEVFLLDGRRWAVRRGFEEVDVRAGTNFTFTLIAAHLKSRLPDADADEGDLRLAEARVLRGIIDRHFRADPAAKLVVLGDFNDLPNAPSTRAVLGRGKFRLFDTRPAEANGDDGPNPEPRRPRRNIVWTHYYAVDETYARIDYILASPAMKRCWSAEGTVIPRVADWGVGSDHRPIVATFDLTGGKNPDP